MSMELLALAAQVEAMRGPTCVIDALVSVAVGDAGANSDGFTNLRVDPDDDGWLLFEMGTEECCNKAPPYTFSLDAALSLVPSGWVCTHAYFNDERAVFNFTKWRDGNPMYASGAAATPALALTAAALRARATTPHKGADDVE